MSGKDLIQWAVGACAHSGYPPNDSNLLMFIRGIVEIPKEVPTPKVTVEEVKG